MFSRAIPQTTARLSRAGKHEAAGRSPCSPASSAPAHALPFPLLSACGDAKPAPSEPRAAFWHILRWRDHDPSTCRAHWEAPGRRERQGKRAAAPPHPSSPSPRHLPRSYVQDWQIKGNQIAVASIVDPKIEPQGRLATGKVWNMLLRRDHPVASLQSR